MNSWSFPALLVLYLLLAVDVIRTEAVRGMYNQVHTVEEDGGAHGNLHIGNDNQVNTLEGGSRSSGDTSEDSSSNQKEDGNSNQCDGGDCGDVLIGDDDDGLMGKINNAVHLVSRLAHNLTHWADQKIAKFGPVNHLEGELSSLKEEVAGFKNRTREAEHGLKKEINSLKEEVDELKIKVGKGQAVKAAIREALDNASEHNESEHSSQETK